MAQYKWVEAASEEEAKELAQGAPFKDSYNELKQIPQFEIRATLDERDLA